MDVALVEIVERDAAELADPHASVEQHEHRDMVAKSKLGAEVAGAKEGIQVVMSEGPHDAFRLSRLMQAKRGVMPDHFLIYQPLVDRIHGAGRLHLTNRSECITIADTIRWTRRGRVHAFVMHSEEAL